MRWSEDLLRYMRLDRAPAQGDHGGESSGNNASNGTTQRLDKAEEAAGEASTAAKPPSDDLQELANRGLCAPLWRTAKPSQPVRIPTHTRPFNTL